MRALLNSLLLAAAAGCVLLAPPARAASVIVTFSGTIHQVDDPTGEAGLAPGTPFTATAVYDDGTSSPPVPVEHGVESYNWMASPPASISFEAGAWQIGVGPFSVDDASSGPGFHIDLADRISDGTFFADSVRWHTVVGGVAGLDVPFYTGVLGGLCCSYLDLNLLGDEGTLPSPSLDEIPFDLAAWVEARLGITLFLDEFANEEIFVGGTITSISVIPEPSTLALVATALLGLAAGRSTRSRIRRH